MKKFLGLVLLILCLVSPAFASTSVQLLQDTSGTDIEDYSLTSGSAVQSAKIRVQDNAGFMTLLVTEDKAGGTGDVDIYVEYSINSSDWHRAYTSNMAGTITIEGNIVTALQNVSRYMIFTPRLAPYVRVVFDPDADSEVTAHLLYLSD